VITDNLDGIFDWFSHLHGYVIEILRVEAADDFEELPKLKEESKEVFAVRRRNIY
jgi:hypothetical protein